MTERTVIKKMVSAAADDDNYDSISTNSTEASEGNENRLYDVECILTEGEFDGETLYLVKWDQYPIEVSTWEPEENITLGEERTYKEWQDEKFRIKRGNSKPFDLDAWEEQVKRFKQAREDRKRKRRAKRKRRGISISPSETEFSGVSTAPLLNSNFSDETQEGTDELSSLPGYGTSRKRQRHPLKTESRLFVVKDDTSENEILRRVRSPRLRSNKADTANLSEGSLVESLNSKAAMRSRQELEGGDQQNKFTSKDRKKPERQPNDFELPSPTTSSHQKTPNLEALPSQRQANVPEAVNRSRTEDPSRTGYQGTANRSSVSRPFTQSARGGAATRGSMRGRRGGSILEGRISDRPSFAGPAPPVERRTLTKALLGPKKQNEHFKTMSTKRKAELAGRAIADRAPDPDSLTLVNPAEHRTFKMPKKPKYGGAAKNPEPKILSNKETKRRGSFVEDSANCLLEEPYGLDSSIHVSENNAKDSLARRKSIRAEKQISSEEEIRARTSAIMSPQAFERSDGSFPTQPTNSDATLTGFDTSINNSANAMNGSANSFAMEVSQTAFEDSTPPHPVIPRKPVTKMKLSEYKTRQASEYLSTKMTTTAIFGDDSSQSASIIFTDIDQNGQQPWIQELRSFTCVKFNTTCLSDNFKIRQNDLEGLSLASGSIMTDCAGTSVLNHVVAALRPASGVVFVHNAFIILLFPTRCDEWKFLETPGLVRGDTLLGYFIFVPKVGVNNLLDQLAQGSALSLINLQRDYLESIVTQNQGLDCKRLLPVRTVGSKSQSFFLLFPPQSAATATFFEIWLHACNPEYRIFTSQKPGAWCYFTSQTAFDTGVVLIHETLVPEIFKLPHLLRLLNGEVAYTFWSVSDCSFATPLCRPLGGEEWPPTGTTVTRLLPQGGVVFLTPSFLVAEPEETNQLLTFISWRFENSFAETWKLVACYNFRQYLHDLALTAAKRSTELYSGFSSDEKHHDEMASEFGLSRKQCELRFLNYSLLDSILTNDRMAGYPYSWDEDEPSEVECPIIYADKSIGQNDERRLVEWFGSWTMTKLDLFRKFIVVGTKLPGSAVKIRPKEKKQSGLEASVYTTVVPGLQSNSNVQTETEIRRSTNSIGKITLSTSKSETTPAATFGKESLQMHKSNDDPGLTAQESPEPDLLNPTGRRPFNATSSIWLGRIPRFVNDWKLQNMFAKYGSILSTRVVSGKGRGLDGYVNFEYINSAINAVYQLSDQELFLGEGPQRINFTTPKHLNGSNRPPASVPSLTLDLKGAPVIGAKHPQKPSLVNPDEKIPSNATSSIWLGNLPETISTQELEEIFKRYGPILSTRIVRRRVGVGLDGYVNFVYTNSAINATSTMVTKELVSGSGPVKVNFAKTPFGYSSPPGSPTLDRDSTARAIFPESVSSEGSEKALYDKLSSLLRLPSKPLKHASVISQSECLAEDCTMTGQDRAGDDIAMEIAEDPLHLDLRQLTRSISDFDKTASTKVLEFSLVSGSDPATAELYLKNYQGRSFQAFQHYVRDKFPFSDSQALPLQGGNSMRLPDSTELLRFIEGTEADAQPRSAGYLVHEDTRRAIEIYQSWSPGTVPESRPQSRTGLVTDPDNARRFVSSSIRPSGSTQPEISIRSGFTPPENKEVFKNQRAIDVVPQYTIGDSVSSDYQSELGTLGPQWGRVSIGRGPTSESYGQDSMMGSGFDVNFEKTTVDWYEKLREERHGWEHVLVCDSSEAFRVLGIKPK